MTDSPNPLLNSATVAAFTCLSAADIRKMSVKRIVNPQAFDMLNLPTKGGLYDPALGPNGKGDICTTCKLISFDCPGHFGHIDLPTPVFHPLFMTTLYTLLRGTCLYCHKFLKSRYEIYRTTAKLVLLEHGLNIEAHMVDDFEMIRVKDPEEKNEKSIGELESPEAFRTRLFTWVTLCMKNKPNVSRDNYKTSICFDLRRKEIHSFLKTLNQRAKRCNSCSAYAPKISKEGHLKFVERSLSPREKATMEANKLQRKSVSEILLLASKSSASKKQQESIHQNNNNANGIPNGDNDDDKMSVDENSSDDNNDDDDESSEENAVVIPADGSKKRRAADNKKDEAASKATSKRQKLEERTMLPEECRAHMRLLFENEKEILSRIFSSHGVPGTIPIADPDAFFMEAISVPPSRFRPASVMGEQTYENPQTELLGRVVQLCHNVRDSNEALKQSMDKSVANNNSELRSQAYTRLLQSLFNMQVAVNSFIDSGKNPTIARQGKLPPPGIKQILEKKEGLFRNNMMGKRVNYAARSVISPDVNIETNEIGVPPIFAKRLTFPEPVTPHNVKKLMQAVINGPHKHPGANYIQMEDGRLQSLERLSDEERNALANQLLNRDAKASSARPDVGLPSTISPPLNRKVYRHLEDGDILILNRQPTLHKPSMMCHRARILKGEKTIRMHYANCNSYNADFDGDEMNMHFPQSLAAQAEAKLIANTDNQYLVPTSGKPLRGLIQDHVVAGTWMTSKDSFFTREEYQQLIFSALSISFHTRVKTVCPAIIKPVPLWTGKQVITTILLNIKPENSNPLNIASKSKVPGGQWGEHSSEDSVIFVDGNMVSGILDKSQMGATAYGLVHAVYELYGTDAAGKLLGTLSRLLTKYLQHQAFTCGMDDLKLSPDGDAWRRELAKESKDRGLKAALKYVGLGDDLTNLSPAEKQKELNNRLAEVLLDDNMAAGLDAAMSSEVQDLASKIIKKTIPQGLMKPFPYNGMQTMTLSGAKGSTVNASSISCQLGQQTLEGRRVPVMISGKTLPSFLPFETDPKAGGYVAGRFLTGIRPQEYYFHCMAGREGLIDTAVKTSRSGYLQRCLIKHLEGIKVHYDHTVRNADSSVIQFNYGEDGLDVTKHSYLEQFEFAMRNVKTLLDRHLPDFEDGKFDDGRAVAHMAEVLAQDPDQTEHNKLPPTLSIYSPTSYVGAVSERFAREVEKYIAENPQKLLKSKKKIRKQWPDYIPQDNLLLPEQFSSLMNIRYMRTLVEPGEAVGLLASQGVGEPSTQMTLNTFHFAGHGAANVTLGIPRLREIVMTASQDIKTPTMSLPLLKSKASQDDLETLAKRMTRLTLSEVIDDIIVQEKLVPKSTRGTRKKVYSVTINFYPRKEYEEEYNIKPENLLHCLVHHFSQVVDNAIMTEQTRRAKDDKSQPADLGKGHKSKNDVAGEGDGNDDESDEVIEKASKRHGDDEKGDGDADDAKRESRTKQQTSYDEDDEAEESGDSDDDDVASSIEADFASDNEDEEEESDSESSGSEQKSNSSRGKLEALEESLKSRYISSIDFDKAEGLYCKMDLEFSSTAHKLLLVGLLEKCARKAVIREIPKIKRCFVTPAQKTGEDASVTTEGCNIQEMWKECFGVIDLNGISSNDVGAILRTYGVEAARQSVVNEIAAVFRVYGIGVDYRHLSLIADYMTSEGGYKPFNRTGLSNSPSPFLKASFETTSNFISEAALYGDFDDLTSPASSIVMGQLATTGTGAFSVLADNNT